jgi:hypothetical protein
MHVMRDSHFDPYISCQTTGLPGLDDLDFRIELGRMCLVLVRGFQASINIGLTL